MRSNIHFPKIRLQFIQMKDPAPALIHSPFFDDEDVKDRLRFEMAPQVDFVRRTLDSLDETEKNIRQKETEEIDKEGKRAEDLKNLLVISRPPSALREEYRVVLPLQARYAALTSAVTGLELLVHSLHAAGYDLAKFAQHRNSRKYGDGDAAANQRFEEAQKIIKRGRKIGRERIEGALRRMGKEWAKLQQGAENFSDLRAVRHAVVHCGGAVEKFNKPEKLREAINRLPGFHAVEETVEVDGEEFLMPLSQGPPEEQIWIERGALNPPVKQTLDFIGEIHDAHFG